MKNVLQPKLRIFSFLFWRSHSALNRPFFSLSCPPEGRAFASRAPSGAGERPSPSPCAGPRRARSPQRRRRQGENGVVEAGEDPAMAKNQAASLPPSFLPQAHLQRSPSPPLSCARTLHSTDSPPRECDTRRSLLVRCKKINGRQRRIPGGSLSCSLF